MQEQKPQILQVSRSSYKKWIALAIAAFLVLAVPITIFLINRQQSARSEATAATTLFFNPSTINTQASCQESTVDLMLDPGTNVISIVDIDFDYEPQRIDILEIVPDAAFAGSPATIINGTASASWVAANGGYVQEATRVMTFKFKPKLTGATYINIKPTTRVFSLGPDDFPTENVLASASNATINISPGTCGENISPTLSPTSSQTIPTVSPSPQAADNSVSGIVFFDSNKNGAKDAGEPGLKDIEITVMPESALSDDINCTLGRCMTNGTIIAKSGENGFYKAEGLISGKSYIVELGLISGYWPTTRMTYIFTLTKAETIDFGLTDTEPPSPIFIKSGLNISLELSGIGSDSAKGLNDNPQNKNRQINGIVYDSNNKYVTQFVDYLMFDIASGRFKGTANLYNLPESNYTIKIRTNNTLFKNIPGIVRLVPNTTQNSTNLSAIPSDLNWDNKLDLTDYNLMYSCFHNPTCNTALPIPTTWPGVTYSTEGRKIFDLNDDGKIDELDLNLLYAGFRSIEGD